jgi:hypothetical protein
MYKLTPKTLKATECEGKLIRGYHRVCRRGRGCRLLRCLLPPQQLFDANLHRIRLSPRVLFQGNEVSVTIEFRRGRIEGYA